MSLPSLILTWPFKEGRGPQIPERMRWTSSAIKTFRSCPRKFYWTYIARLRSRAKGEPLIVGTAFHHVTAKWYKSRRVSMGRIVDTHLRGLYEELEASASYYDGDDLAKVRDALQKFKGMCLGFSECYRSDRNEWVIDRNTIESEFVMDMGDFDYAGSLDMSTHTRQDKTPFLVERKTTSALNDTYVQRLALDTQTRGYLYAVREHFDIEAAFVLYCVTRKCKLRRKANEEEADFHQRIADDYMSRPDFYFHREQLRFRKSDLEAWKFEVEQTHEQYLRIIERSEKVGMNPLNPRAWPINDGSCNMFFRLCPYHHACTGGVDQRTALMLDHEDKLNPELETI